MDFTAIVQETVIDEAITIDSFIKLVASYGNLDNAILELDDKMLQYYSDNLRVIDKLLRKHNLVESTGSYGSAENPGYTGWTRSDDDKTKTIKYRGHIISLSWDAKLATWQPTVRFRSVSDSLKYGKMLVNHWRDL